MTDAQLKDSKAFLAKRYSAERRFKLYGAAALAITTAFLVFLLVDIGRKGAPAFFEHRATLQVLIDPAKIDAADPAGGDFEALVKQAFVAQFPEITARSELKQIKSMLSQGASNDLRDTIIADPL